ncbi:hypothetical protein SADUNF_Sadunf16G0026800 [Salix dunnii]|uniref:Uncharacterized protein n=1 Tax=Salix dunnii TaxID=1413687 RepID=A0A835J6S0_9ROSI|nr:hypothetical protein SADUNF_Sadunf16G0026800 [Salix dunnii]
MKTQKKPSSRTFPLTAIQRRISYFELLRLTNEFHESSLLSVGSYNSVKSRGASWWAMRIQKF